MKNKLKWRVDAAPTGKYRSFAVRGWPTAEVAGVTVAALYAVDSYTEYSSRTKETAPLVVRVADRSKPGPFKWATLKARPTGLTGAKQAAEDFYARHPEWLPPEEPRK